MGAKKGNRGQENLRPRDHLWKKGQSGNPSGRPKTPEHLRKAAKVSAQTLKLELMAFLVNTEDQVKKIADDKEAGILRRIMAKTCLDALNGNQRATELLLERSIGKVKDEIEVRLPKPMIVENLEGDSKLLGAIEAEVVEETPDDV